VGNDLIHADLQLSGSFLDCYKNIYFDTVMVFVASLPHQMFLLLADTVVYPYAEDFRYYPTCSEAPLLSFSGI